MFRKYIMPLLVLAALGYGALFALAKVRAPFPARIWLRYGPVDDEGKPTWDVSDVRDEPRGESVLYDYVVEVVEGKITLRSTPNWGDKQLKRLGHRFQPETKPYQQAGQKRSNEEGTWWLFQKLQER
jgi:hypothetical protein